MLNPLLFLRKKSPWRLARRGLPPTGCRVAQKRSFWASNRHGGDFFRNSNFIMNFKKVECNDRKIEMFA